MSRIEQGIIPSEVDLSVDPKVISQAEKLLGTEPNIERAREWIHSPEKQRREKIIAGAILTCLTPLLSLSARGVLLVDGKPAFYKYTVAFPGPNGTLINPREFTKIRTLRLNASDQEKSPFETTAFQGGRKKDYEETDPRVHSQLGSLLRKTSLDEVPQLEDVISGEISLIGLRPFTLEEIKGLRVVLENLDQREELKEYLENYLEIMAYIAPLPSVASPYAATLKKKLTSIERLVLDQLYCLCATKEGDNRILVRSIITTLKRTGAK
ncbi:hypothetical protein A2Z41_01580 [Microgenomates group bacterium RBG_19FT_COMBO_39_10]|nr:MAG: hypothetical protein A2Z41_01580 [Microgenomates group bacterium RBG_19FT_COMBO_39_10]